MKEKTPKSLFSEANEIGRNYSINIVHYCVILLTTVGIYRRLNLLLHGQTLADRTNPGPSFKL
jgi:hypothetical protein